ncbi:MAG: glycosyltransferase [Pseudomonadota bacterium]
MLMINSPRQQDSPLETNGDGTRSLRIGVVAHAFPLLSETFVTNQTLGLLALGHDVEILALHAGAPTKSALTAAGVNPSFAVRIATPTRSGAAWEKLLRTGAGLIGDPGLAARALPMGWRARPRMAGAFLQAQMLKRRAPYDVVHAQFGDLGLAALRQIELGALSTRKLVVHFRGYDLGQFVRKHGEDVYEAVFARADHMLTNCEHFRRKIISLGGPAERVSVIGSGVDTDLFPFVERMQNGEAGEIRIAAVGRLIEKKGFEYALRAVAGLSQAGRNVRFELAGDGPLRAELAALAAELGVAADTVFHGQATQPQVAELLARADLFIAPSVTASNGDEDAAINTLKEAMLSGLPVVSTRHGGIPELVEHGVSGYLAPERDAAALKACLERLLAERDRWLEMGRAGRARVLDAYDRRRVNERIEALYRRLLAA